MSTRERHPWDCEPGTSIFPQTSTKYFPFPAQLRTDYLQNCPTKSKGQTLYLPTGSPFGPTIPSLVHEGVLREVQHSGFRKTRRSEESSRCSKYCNFPPITFWRTWGEIRIHVTHGRKGEANEQPRPEKGSTNFQNPGGYGEEKERRSLHRHGGSWLHQRPAPPHQPS